MAVDHTIGNYRRWYARLLRLYPKPFYTRFGEGMEQTFTDLCRDRKDTENGLFGFVLWMFVETTAGIIRENMTTLITHNKNILRIALVTACLLMIPLLAMQFTKEVQWTLSDFVFAGLLLFSTGLAYELISRRSASTTYKAGVAVGVVTGLFLIWVNLAVGIIGSEDNPANLLYGGVLLVGLFGAAFANLQAKGMSRTMFATAIAQMLVPVTAMIMFRPSLDDPPGIVGVFMLNGFFAFLFTVSGLLFRHSASKQNQN